MLIFLNLFLHDSSFQENLDPIWNTKKRKEEDTIDVSQVAKNISRFMHHGNQTHFKEYKEWLMKLQQEINDVKNKK